MNKKLTDAEIVKAWEICAKKFRDCIECPARILSHNGDVCSVLLRQMCLDLFNRLQAENTILLGKIEDLEANSVELLENIEQLESVITQTKAEAYKECIQKIKVKSKKEHLVCSGASLRTDYTITDKELYNLYKELVGDK